MNNIHPTIEQALKPFIFPRFYKYKVKCQYGETVYENEVTAFSDGQAAEIARGIIARENLTTKYFVKVIDLEAV